MKTLLEVESFDGMRARKLARAQKLTKGESMSSEKRITFETPADLLACLTPKRVRLCEVAREKPRSISELAVTLQRDRKSVHRDVQALHLVGMLRLHRRINPGHGQIQVVEATATRFRLIAEL